MNNSNIKKNIHLTYSAEEIIKNSKRIYFDNNVCNDIKLSNYIGQTFASLFYENTEVGKIFFYSNRTYGITDVPEIYQNFENVAIKLYSSPCFEENTFAIGNLFYEGNSFIVFNKNREYNFKAVSTGGSFENSCVNVNIKTDETPIRHVIIKVDELNCKCDN